MTPYGNGTDRGCAREQSSAGQRRVPQWIDMTPAGRLGNVTDLQGAIVYLASPASDFMTGHDLVLDGGYGVW